MRRLKRQRAHGAGRIVAGVLRKSGGAHHEQVRHVPDLQMLVDRAGAGIGAHHKAADDVRGLIRHAAPVAGHRFNDHLARVHRFGDLRHFAGAVLRHLQIVVRKVEGNAQQRTAVRIFIVGIERKVVGARGIAAGLAADRHGAEVVIFQRALPFRSPLRRAGRQRTIADGRGADRRHADAAAAEEAEAAVVEVIVVELVDAHADRARADKGIEVLVIEKQRHVVGGLIGVVAAGGALVGDRIVGLADLRQQHQAHVLKGKGGDNHQIGWLFPGIAGGVDVGDAGRFFAAGVGQHLQHFAVGIGGKVLFAHQRGQHGGNGAGFGVVGAAVVRAEAAKGAGAHGDAVGIGIGLGDQRRGHREGLIAHLFRRLREQRRAVRLTQRRRGIVAAARAFERVAAGALLAVEVARVARGARDALKLHIVRLHLFPGGAPVLQSELAGHRVGAVTLGEIALQLEFVRLKAKGNARPVVARAAGAVAGMKGSPGAHRQRGLRRVIAHGAGILPRAQHQLFAHHIAQFIGHGADIEIARGIAPRSALDADHL